MKRGYVRRGWLLIVLVVLAGVFVIAAQLGRTVDIACTRTTGACTIQTRTLLWSLAPRTVPLAQIDRFSLGETTTKIQATKSRTSAINESVIVFLKDGDRVDLNDYSFFDGMTTGKSDAVTALEAFRQDPLRTSVAADFGGHTTALLAALIFYLFLVPVGAYLVYARVWFEPAKHGLRVIVVRGMFRAAGGSECIVHAGDRIELDEGSRMFYRRGEKPREEVPLPPMSRPEAAELALALEQAISQLA